MTTRSKHATLLQGLTLAHAALRRSLETIIGISGQPIPASDRAGFADFTEAFAKFLRVHHDGEEKIIFPELSRAAEGASMPEHVAHVATWREDHVKLLVHLGDLETACAQFRATGTQDALARAAVDVRGVLFPHLQAEEDAIDEVALQKLMTGDQAMAIARAASKHGQRHGGPKVLMLFLHGLTDEEQTHFSTMPWLVRNVLVKRIWERGFRECLKYAHNPSIAI